MTESTQTPKLKPAVAAPAFVLPGVNGANIALGDVVHSSSAVVILFICNHCPYVQAYIPRLIALQNEFLGGVGGGKPVRFLAINSNDSQTYPQDGFEQMKIYASRWGLNFSYLHDDSQAVARAYGANRTPEIFVLDSSGVCRYEGGIDDNYQNESKVTRRPLRDAIVAVAAGQNVAQPTSHAIGCTIKWKKQ